MFRYVKNKSTIRGGNKMKILMFSWEYSPISHGGLARHVQDLSEAMVKHGHTVYIITQGDNNIPSQEEINGVNVVRTEKVQISANNFVDNILHLNFQLMEEAIKLIKKIGEPDIIHGHDWLVFWASKVLKHSLTKPLVYTIHATEYGRNQGIYDDMQRYINDIEWYANFEAWNVIVCSQYMKDEIKGLFQVPADKINVVKNGVNPDNYKASYSEKFRSLYVASDEKMVFYVGRIVREKGIQVLIQSVPDILKGEPNTKFVIAGKGSFLDNLKKQARYLGIEDRIYFTGFVSDKIRNKLYQVADLAVFPSLYEPFGIVALEAMSTKTPVIVSNVGGMTEFVKHEKNGIKVEPGNPSQLARAIKDLLHDKKKATSIASRGYKIAKEKYSWDKIAEKTINIYQKVLKEYSESNWNINDNKTYTAKEEKKQAFAGYRYM